MPKKKRKPFIDKIVIATDDSPVLSSSGLEFALGNNHSEEMKVAQQPLQMKEKEQSFGTPAWRGRGRGGHSHLITDGKPHSMLTNNNDICLDNVNCDFNSKKNPEAHELETLVCRESADEVYDTPK